MEQLILHLIGDYVTQSDWMAERKSKSSWAAFCHVTVYSLPFLLIASPEAVAVVFGTHFIIDRWRLARFLTFASGHLAPISRWPSWKDCSATGYPEDRPAWMAVWLLIVVDNTLHIVCNYLALKYL